MKNLLSAKLIELAENLPSPLYVVGGFCRNFLIDGRASKDIDLASSMSVDELSPLLKELGFEILAEYKRTETLLFKEENQKYEYTGFREEEYEDGGFHTPKFTRRTNDIKKDAMRRDFKCNAIYYDIKKAKFVDVLGGIDDVKNKKLDTVIEPDKVFCHDGLRLMRLARFVGELDFTPTKEVEESAKNNAKNILDISKERIYSELKTLLIADTKYPFSAKDGHYKALKVLDRTRVLDYIFPTLTKGRNMLQRKDYHNYDVLEHSLRAALYAPKGARLYALLHDIGKPYAMQTDGKYYNHAKYGESLTEEALKNISADNATIETAVFLTGNHMLDKKLDAPENKIRVFIVENYDKLDLLFKIMQADYMAYKDFVDEAPTVVKWKGLMEKMKKEGVPFTLKELKITAQNLINAGIKGENIGKTLKKLHKHCIINPADNKLEKLIVLANKKL